MKKLQILIITFLIGLSICALAGGQTIAQDNASYLVVSSGLSQTAGTSFNFTVTAYNSNGTVATNYTGTITFTSSDSGTGVVLPNAYTFTATDAGEANFSATLVTVGSQSITASDNSNSSISGLQNGIQVNPTTLNHYGISVPSSVTAGSNFDGVNVTAYDAYNNTISDYAGSIYFISSDSAATLPYTSTSEYTFVSDDNGSHTFSDFTLDTAPSQTITVTDNSTSEQSASIMMNPSSLNKFVVGAPSSATAGTTFTLTITAKDAYGNTITTYNDSINLNASLGTVNPTNTGNSSWSSGVWNNSLVTLSAAGSITITADDGSNHTGTASVPVSAGSLAMVTVSGPSSIDAGGNATFTANCFDAESNSLGVQTATWSISSGAGGSWSGNIYTSANAGFWIITATYNGLSNSVELTVNPAELTHFTFNTVATQTAGTTFNITITALDAYGNTVTEYNGTPTLSVSIGTITPTITEVFSSGVWTGLVSLTTPSLNATIKAADGTSAGESNSFTVNPTIFASASLGGSISPTGSITVNYGGNQEFNIMASTGYSIANVLVNGTSVGAVSSLPFTNVEDDYIISATFTKNVASTPTPTTAPTPASSPSPKPTASPEPTSKPTPTTTPDATHLQAPPKSTSSPTLATSLDVLLVAITTAAVIIIVITIIAVVRLKRESYETQITEIQT